MDWLEPIVKWGALFGALFLGFALQRKRAQKRGKTEEKLDQMREGNRAQDRQRYEMLLAAKRDLLDDLERVRDRKNRS